jgi:two-component system, chemotaxis family, CheB/CheR fusion protein
MGLNHIAAIGDYAQYLADIPAELKALAKDLLIGVTEFFREPEAWAVLEAEVIPELVAAKHPEAPLCVWVTGCATGEEAYSIGMCFHERMASSERNGELQIFATDIDRHAPEIARVGTYPRAWLRPSLRSVLPGSSPSPTIATGSKRSCAKRWCLHRRT